MADDYAKGKIMSDCMNCGSADSFLVSEGYVKHVDPTYAEWEEYAHDRDVESYEERYR
jgi:hypothetical protein